MVGVNDLLYVALECFYISVNWKGGLVGLRPVVASLGCMSYVSLYSDHGKYGFEYDVGFYHEFIVNLVIQFCFSEYAKFFKDVHLSSFPCYMNDVHDVLHRASSMSIVY